jgi:16S rRNA (cytidine1402-2'-O)-methyltransferase
MRQQRSYQHESNHGALYLVPTPIGNLEDMTFRAVRILKEADVIAAEDTRQTKKLCHYFEIKTPMVSYHEHNKEKSGVGLLSKLAEGSAVALVSDAGTPAISDPGYKLTASCIKREIPVIPLPGANAALTALIASGLNTDHFFFYGFLPRSKKEREKELQRIKEMKETLIFYEAPHRLKEMLGHLQNVFGERHVSIARELTKKYEEIIRGTIKEILEWVESNTLKGEFCIVIEGAVNSHTKREEQWWESVSVYDHVEHYVLIRKMIAKDAIKQTAKERGLPKRDVYHAYHIDR